MIGEKVCREQRVKLAEGKGLYCLPWRTEEDRSLYIKQGNERTKSRHNDFEVQSTTGR